MKISPVFKDRLEVDRFVVPYRVYGNGGPHVVCLNGVQQSMAMWQKFIRHFAPYYRIVLFDFPDQGKGKITSGSHTITLEEQVEILQRVITASHLKDITLCSASWGGVVAMAFAVKYPDLVKRLCLGSLGTKPNQRMVETIQAGFQIDPNEREKMADTLITSFGAELPEDIKHKIIRQFNSMSKDHLNAFCKHGIFVIETKNLQEVINLEKIKAETYLINGANDTIIDLDDVKKLATQIPNCRLKIIKDVGHFLHLESDNVFDVYRSVLT